MRSRHGNGIGKLVGAESEYDDELEESEVIWDVEWDGGDTGRVRESELFLISERKSNPTGNTKGLIKVLYRLSTTQPDDCFKMIESLRKKIALEEALLTERQIIDERVRVYHENGGDRFKLQIG